MAHGTALNEQKYCEQVKCEVVQSPSDTTHFFQPYDREMNIQILSFSRELRDRLCKCTSIDVQTVQVTLGCDFYTYYNNTRSIIFQSCADTELWLTNYLFLDKYDKRKVRACEATRWQSAKLRRGQCCTKIRPRNFE